MRKARGGVDPEASREASRRERERLTFGYLTSYENEMLRRRGRARIRAARAEVVERRKALLRVVPTKWAMSQLRKRCTISRECGNWVELLDAASNQYIYYNKQTEENQWLPPLELSARFWCV